jgi:hypothetical protein
MYLNGAGRALKETLQLEPHRAPASALEDVFPGNKIYDGLVTWCALTFIIYHIILASLGGLGWFGLRQAFSLYMACPVAFVLTLFCRKLQLLSDMGSP